MNMKTSSDQSENELRNLFKTYFCDVADQEKHESKLKKHTDNYLSQFPFKQNEKIYRALADEKRLKILRLLTFREMCVCELTAALNLTQPNLTHHVKKLENADLVDHEKRGKWVYYSINDEEHLQALGAI
jgi:DNA-binding transcriptional ArsR family regulator